jgi:hypothetical protein
VIPFLSWDVAVAAGKDHRQWGEARHSGCAGYGEGARAGAG